MADNVTLDSGTGGAVIRTDDDGTAHWQYVKVAYGADDTQTIVGSTSSNPFPVALSDTDNAVLDSIQTAVETIDNIVQAEDAVHSSGASGVMTLAVRNDTLAALAGADGDYAPLQVNASGALFIQEGSALDVSAANVTVVGTGTFAAQIDGDALTALQVIDNPVFADDAAFTLASSSVMVSGAVRDDTLSTLTAIEGDAVPLRVSSTGALHVTGGGGGTEYTEDAAAAGDPTGNAQILVRLDTPATITSTDGDNVARRGTNYGAAYTQIVTSAGAFVDSFGGGTQYAEDAAHTTGDTGTMALAVRNDVLAALAGTDGDYAPLQVNATGALYIQEGSALDVSAANVTVVGTGTLAVQADSVVPGTGATNLGKAEDAVHSSGDTGVMALAVRNDTLAALAGTDGDYAPLQVNATGALFVQEGAAMDVSAATVTVTDDGSFTLASNSGVDIGDVDILSIIPGVGATNLGKAEDAVHASGDTGVMALAVRNDTLAALAGTDGDYAPLQVNATGALFVQEGAAMDVSAATVTVDNGGTFAVQVDNVSGTEDDAAAANETGVILMGVRDDEHAGTAATSTDGDITAIRTDRFGALRVTELPEASGEVKRVAINVASSGDNTIVAAAGAGLRIRVLSVLIMAGGTVNVRWEDGAGGTALTGIVELTAQTGYVLPINQYGWFETSDNTLLNLELSAAVSVDGCITYVEV